MRRSVLTASVSSPCYDDDINERRPLGCCRFVERQTNVQLGEHGLLICATASKLVYSVRWVPRYYALCCRRNSDDIRKFEFLKFCFSVRVERERQAIKELMTRRYSSLKQTVSNRTGRNRSSFERCCQMPDVHGTVCAETLPTCIEQDEM